MTMDTTFENIVPWNGANDTGLDVRKKMERNFDKIKQNFAEIVDEYIKESDLTDELKDFLNRNKEEIVNSLFTFKEGIVSIALSKFFSGIVTGNNFAAGVAGSGGKIDEKGNAELESINVRSYLKVLELIYNRRTAMEGDFDFSEFGTIDSITEVTAGTYNLHFRKRYDNDFIAFHENDILMGVVDPKVNGTGTILYTSYVRVLSVNTTDNTAQVVVYDGSEVPAGTNYPPVTSMNMIRIGNTDSPTDGSVNARQDFWKLSTDEGRIVFLQNVYKPILEAFNYALSIGKLPDLDIFKNLPIGKDDMSIYSKNVVAQNYYKIDSNGIVQTNEVYRGLWSEQVASSEAPYRRIVKETTSGTGTVVNVLEVHTVYHLGCKWACLIDKTTDEPRWNSTGWQMIQGDSNYSIDFSSTNGWQFFYGKVDTIISARIFYGNEDITERTLPLAGISIEWIRNTDNVPEDNAWIPTYVANKLNLKLTTEDMGSNWMTKRTATFTCNIYIPVGEDTQLITNNISFNL